MSKKNPCPLGVAHKTYAATWADGHVVGTSYHVLTIDGVRGRDTLERE